jgi:hypothetical protein
LIGKAGSRLARGKARDFVRKIEFISATSTTFSGQWSPNPNSRCHRLDLSLPKFLYLKLLAVIWEAVLKTLVKVVL